MIRIGGDLPLIHRLIFRKSNTGETPTAQMEDGLYHG